MRNFYVIKRSAIGLTLLMLATFSQGVTTTKDWPQACYNETSMWVTQACKEYIETVYYPSLTTSTTDTSTTTTTSEPAPSDSIFLAGPGPVFGGGVLGLLLVTGTYLFFRRWHASGATLHAQD